MSLSSRILSRLTLILLFLIPLNFLSAQERILDGRVTDTSGVAISGATVTLAGLNRGVSTSEDGSFAIRLDPGKGRQLLVFSCLGYCSDTVAVDPEYHDSILNVRLIPQTIGLESVQVSASRPDNITVIKIPAIAGAVIPSVAGGVEAVIATLPGVASFSELSYSYSVRGGSYDENLVYINDIELYRPYLIKSGQQEGLSRINPDLTAEVNFSPGGFSAAYGDRMSSVLDISYREPEEKEGSISLSLLTSSVHAGTRSRDGKLWFIAGARYRINAILLGSLDARGDYMPRFADLQAMAGYRPGKKTEMTLSLWASSNRYTFIPRSRTTSFGTMENAYRLYAWFEGAERDQYDNCGGAVTLKIRHNEKLMSKLILAASVADEKESYDIRGAYSLSSLDLSEGTENNPDTLLNAGAGSWLSHARNILLNDMADLSYKGSLSKGGNSLEWGLAARYYSNHITRNEWLRVDSAGYTTGGEGDGLMLTSRSYVAGNISSFVTEGWCMSRKSFSIAGRKCDLNTGIRSSYNTYNSELLVSPRISLAIALSHRTSCYIAAGAYHQPPGGKEMMLDVETESDQLKAQRSYHLTVGARYDFTAWDRPFRFTAEAYGKIFNRLIPYTVDNVRLIYYGGNIAEGYSAGIDLRVNGEFVRGVESWISLSVMRSEMRIPLYNTGWFPSPFDQRVNLSIFFQDYLPGHPDFRAHINIAFGTGIPASPPGREQWDVWFRIPPYRRIDIGFSKVLLGNKNLKENSFMKELLAGIEFFNLSDIRNTISYTWIRTVRNSEGQVREYAVPNYLTGRVVNLRLTARF
jgi:outer membrane receptor protein involved in Fe transport